MRHAQQAPIAVAKELDLVLDFQLQADVVCNGNP